MRVNPFVKSILAVLTALAALTAPAFAQDSLPLPPKFKIADSSETARYPVPDSIRPPIPLWRNRIVPVLGGQPNDGPAFGVRARRWMTTPVDDIVTSRAEFNLIAGFTPRGGVFGYFTFYAPRLTRGWRFRGTLSGVKQVRYGFYGLGNNTTYDPDLVTDQDPYLYRMQREQLLVSTEVTKRIVPHFSLALQLAATDDRFRALEGTTVFGSEFGQLVQEDDLWARFAAVYDTRDTEWDTHRGVLLEAGVQYGLFSDDYQRVYSILRAYVPLDSSTTIAGRVMGAALHGSPTFNSRFAVPGWERDVFVLGGEDSHRALNNGRFLGNDVLLTNIEIRRWFWSYGHTLSIGAIGWFDAGRVFEDEPFELTFNDWTAGAGAGIALRILRTNIVQLNYGFGPDGGKLTFKSGWMF